jgi:CRISPR/Cas system-associated exonuclease Cas4 (RecB family)
MVYSYTQISQYLVCPRRYRHRYLDGWQEKDTRVPMLFGRAFERALAAYFLRKDPAATLYQEWALYQKEKLELLTQRNLGSHVAARHSAARSLLPG